MDELADFVEPSDTQKLAGQQDFAPEVWRSIKLASIRGVSDKDLESAFGVKAGTIAVRRHRDEEWTAACKTRVNLGQPNKVRVAENVALLVQENAAQISERNLLLGSKLAEKLLKGAEARVNDGQIEAKDIADIEKIVKIAATVGKWNAPAVTVQQAFTFGTKTADEGILSCESSVIEDSGQYDEQFNLEDGCPV